MPVTYPSAAMPRPVPRTAPIRVLVLDDSRVDRRRIDRMCREADLEVDLFEAASLAAFATALEDAPFDIFLIDYRLGEGDGLIALEMLHRHPVQCAGAAIMVAGEGQIQVAVDAMKAGCGDFLLKDHLTADVLARAIGRALDRGLHAPEARSVEPGAMARAFARDNSVEMRAILSAMLRHVRTIRHAGGPEGALQGVEAATARLWNFLEALRTSERGAQPGTPLPEPVRLN